VWLCSCLVPQIVQSLGDDPAAECNADGLPNRRPSSTSIAALSMNVLQSVPSAKGIKFSVPLAARIAFLVSHLPFSPPAHINQFPKRYCYTVSKDTGRDYWGLVDKKLEEIRGTVKDPSAITQCVHLVPHLSDSWLTPPSHHPPGSSRRSCRSINACMAPPTRRTRNSPTAHHQHVEPLGVLPLQAANENGLNVTIYCCRSHSRPHSLYFVCILIWTASLVSSK
jgi:hypothetical protein